MFDEIVQIFHKTTWPICIQVLHESHEENHWDLWNMRPEKLFLILFGFYLILGILPLAKYLKSNKNLKNLTPVCSILLWFWPHLAPSWRLVQDRQICFSVCRFSWPRRGRHSCCWHVQGCCLRTLWAQLPHHRQGTLSGHPVPAHQGHCAAADLQKK